VGDTSRRDQYVAPPLALLQGVSELPFNQGREIFRDGASAAAGTPAGVLLVFASQLGRDAASDDDAQLVPMPCTALVHSPNAILVRHRWSSPVVVFRRVALGDVVVVGVVVQDGGVVVGRGRGDLTSVTPAVRPFPAAKRAVRMSMMSWSIAGVMGR